MRHSRQQIAAAIRHVVTRRSIRCLLHFTHASNLASIVEYGVLSRAECWCHKIKPRINDPVRLDYLQGYVPTSIEWPNWQLFYRYRKLARPEPDDNWAVLVIRPDIIWAHPCVFTSINASSYSQTSISMKTRGHPEYFEQLFGNEPLRGRGIRREQLQIPDNFPTSPQAEVLVRDLVPPDRILRIVVYSELALRSIARGLPESATNLLKVNPAPFGRRSDWMHWRINTGSFDSVDERDLE